MGKRLLGLAGVAAILVTAAPVPFRALESATGPNATLALGSFQAGESPAHRLTLDIRAGDPEIYRATVVYSDGFRFNGFDALGPAETPVGAYEVDVDLDGAPDRTMAVRALSGDTAYVDMLADGIYSSGFDPVLRRRGQVGLELTLPSGGDANSRTVSARFNARVVLTLLPGLIVSPSLGGKYEVACELVTVDPDTDGASDGSGPEPGVVRSVVPIAIKGPSIVPFARLTVEKFDLKRHRHDRYRFSLHGRFVLGRASDGFDLDNENVSVALDWIKRSHVVTAFSRPGHPSGDDAPQVTRWFSQTIPGAAFDGRGRRHGYGSQFKGDGPGINRFTLSRDGRFDIDASDVALLAGPGRTARVTLRIGTDRGSVAAEVEGKGHDRW